MKLWIEEKEGPLHLTINEAVGILLDEIDFTWVPKSKRKKLIARALVSNLIIDELRGQIKFLNTGG